MTLLLGILGFVTVAFLSMLANIIMLGPRYHGAHPLSLVVVLALLVGLYSIRIWRPRVAAVLFVILLGFCGLAPLTIWGILLPQGLMTCALCIIVAGILISSRGAFITMAIIGASLIGITHLQIIGWLHPEYGWLSHGVNYADAFTLSATLAIMVLVSWLYNRELNKSLQRALASEETVLKERDQLEAKVIERSKELELIQYEKTLQLQRFAEFGRLTSGLVHDLANPLTAVSLNLAQIGGPKSEEVEQAKMSVRFLEQYVKAARKQLQSSGKPDYFNVYAEITGVISILGYKARGAKVLFELGGDEAAQLFGDKAKFNQIMANLLANAIDAYEGLKQAKRRVEVCITRSSDGGQLEVVVHDWGVGMGPTVLKRLFEPFYSTKKDGRGIGVGLVMTKQFVETNFKGTISASSSRKQGTVFTVTIPIKHHGRREQHQPSQ